MVIAGQPDLGFSFNPIKAVKRAAKGAAHATTSVAKAAGKGVVKYGKFALSPMVLVAYATSAAGQLALRPVKTRVHRLTAQRAQKLARDRRHPKPTAADNAEARSWTKMHLKKQGPQGYVLAALAGAPVESNPMGGSFGEPITVATVIAMIPVLLKLVDLATHKASASGELTAKGSAGGGGGSVNAQVNFDVDASGGDGSGGSGGGGGSSGPSAWQKLQAQGQQYASQAEQAIQQGEQYASQAQQTYDTVRNMELPNVDVSADINVRAEGNIASEQSLEGAATSNLGYGIAIGLSALALGTGLVCVLRR